MRMVVQSGIAIIVAFLAGATISLAKDKAPDVQQCFGDLQKTIPLEWEEPCEKLANAKGTTNRDKARIYFQLGLASQENSAKRNMPFEQGSRLAFDLWDKAIATDPSFVEPHIAIARRSARSDQVYAIGYLDRALEQQPGDPALLALKAKTMASVIAGEALKGEMAELCDKAVAAAPEDQSVATSCGYVYGSLKRREEQLKLLRISAKDYDPTVRRNWGLYQDGNPWLDIARVLSRMGRHGEAVDAMNGYYAKQGIGPSPQEIEVRAKYNELAGRFEDAAADFGSMAAFPDYPLRHAAKLNQMFNLIKAEKFDEARTVSEQAFRQGNLRAILLLQVRLKNTDFPDLVINGTYDQQTRDALEQCIKSDACSSGIAGQRL